MAEAGMRTRMKANRAKWHGSSRGSSGGKMTLELNVNNGSVVFARMDLETVEGLLVEGKKVLDDERKRLDP